MGWGRRLIAVFVGLLAFGVGAWPITLLAFLYLFFSLRKPRRQPVYVLKQGEIFTKPERPWKRYAASGFLLFLSLIALESGGTYSPLVLFLGGIGVISWPLIRRSGLANRVVPIHDSVLLRSLVFPFAWYSLVEVKLELQDQARAIASMNGKMILFGGRTSSMFHIVSTLALDYKRAEKKTMKMVKDESRMLSQRGAHLLPIDSSQAAERLSVGLERLKLGTNDLEAISALPFDVLLLHVQDGVIVAHGAFNISGRHGECPIIPTTDTTHIKQPLFVEMVQRIGESHGWPGPDEFSPFLAALDASRTEVFADRIRMKEETTEKLTVETPSGAQVGLTRPQLRALARIYG